MKKLTIFKFKSVACKLLSAIFLSVCIIFSICLYYSFAEVPCKINYQGRLIKDNVPVDGTKPMSFSIYDDAAGGTLLWTSEGVDVEVYNGLFRYVLDLSSINWAAGETLYLEVKVDGETLTPREEMSAYPYAINSHLLEGEAKEYFLNTSGDAQTKQGDLNIMGNVGIGTTSPGERLHVVGGDIKISHGDESKIIYSSHNLYIQNEGYAYQRIHLRPGGSTTGNLNTTLSMYNTDTASPPNYTKTVDIKSSGNSYFNGGKVGIGTASPQAKLHIGGTAGTDGIMFPDGTLQITAGGGFGVWNDRNKDGGADTVTYNVIYQATTDGFVIASVEGDSQILAYTHANQASVTNNNAAALRAIEHHGQNNWYNWGSITMPVKKGDYWKIRRIYTGGTGTVTVQWMPIGN